MLSEKGRKKMQSSLYYHGNFITMAKEEKKVEAIVIEEGRIEKVGTLEEVLKGKEENTQMIDLDGKTMLPAFIDSHSHITALAQIETLINLKDCKTIEEIIQTMKEEKEKKHIEEDEWIIGFGYDHNFLVEKRHPNKFELDKISTRNPILITHTSGHMGVINSVGLEKMNLNEAKEDPKGGKYGRIGESRELDGYLEENAFIESSRIVGRVSNEQWIQAIQKVQQIYFQNGITTIQDGLTKKEEWEVLKQAAEKNRLEADVVTYIEINSSHELVKENKEYCYQYQNHLKIGGYKTILDGSPQGRTAWLSTPYEGEKEYRGYPAKQEERLKEEVRKSIEEKMQLLAHCNGDAASEQYIQVMEQLQEEGENIEEIRPVMIHAQTVRKDQLKRMKKINCIPSFFIAHVYYWGDIHLKNLGRRAEKISPAKAAVEEGLIYTFHQDTPVIMPNMLETIWCATNRKTREGKTLGQEERVSVYEALKAVTINAAYQYFEEREKGSIEEGKLADLIILDKNILEVEIEKIKEIEVLTTIKEGKVVYQKQT